MHLLVKFRSYGYRNLDFVTKSLIFCVFRKFTLFLTSIGDILGFWKGGILEKGVDLEKGVWSPYQLWRKPVLDSGWLNNWKWLAPDLIRGSWIFWPVQIQQKRMNRMNFDWPKVSNMNINFELPKISKMELSAKWNSLKLYISSHREARNIKFGQ